jgi:hypothetical protein
LDLIGLDLIGLDEVVPVNRLAAGEAGVI